MIFVLKATLSYAYELLLTLYSIITSRGIQGIKWDAEYRLQVDCI